MRIKSLILGLMSLLCVAAAPIPVIEGIERTTVVWDFLRGLKLKGVLLPSPTGDTTKFLAGDWTYRTPVGGGGDTLGPASAVDNAILRFDGTTGKLLQNSLATISDAGTLSISPTPAGTSQGFNVSQSLPLTGGPGTGEVNLNIIDVTADGYNVGDVVGLNIFQRFGGNAVGQRVALSATSVQLSATNSAGGAIGGYIRGVTLANMGGTANTLAGGKGGAFGLNVQAKLDTGATFQSSVGIEVDAIQNVDSAVRIGVGVVSFDETNGNHQGQVFDNAFSLWGAGTNSGFKTMLEVTDWGGGPGLTSASRIFGTTFAAGPYTIANGFDLTGFTITGNAFKSAGFTVDGSGNIRNAASAKVPYVASVTRPNEALTNSAAADADFASIYTIPASKLVAGKVLRVVLRYIIVPGATPASELFYLKLGATKVYIPSSAEAPTASVTRNYALEYLIFGTAAAGASVVVDVAGIKTTGNLVSSNTVAAQSLATNGTLTIVPGLTWGSNTNLDTLTLVNAMVEELN